MSRVLSSRALDGAEVVDVVVVGSGAAGSLAALKAKWDAPAAKVVLVEKAAVAGGTTAKSGGTFWIPDNPLLREQGLTDNKAELLPWMAQYAYGKDLADLSALENGWLEQYCTLGAEMCDELRRRGAMPLTQPRFLDGQLVYDYNDFESNPCKQGRMLGAGMPAWQRWLLHSARTASGLAAGLRTRYPGLKDLLNLKEFNLDISYGIGLTLVARLQAALKSASVDVRLQHSVDAVVEKDGAVVGVRLTTPEGPKVVAASAVIFGSGGFSHDPELRRKYLGFKTVDGTAAAAGCTGDFLRISEDLGLDLAHMDKIWGGQCYAEQSAETFETAGSLFQFRGDSDILVNSAAVRVMNEKKSYDVRMRHHWECPENRFLILVADRRAVDLYGNDFIAMTLPGDPSNPLYVRGNSPAELATKLRPRVAALAAKQGVLGYELAPDFDTQLAKTIARFNGFANAGVDADFHRGESDAERQWHFRFSDKPNACMHPLDATDLFAIIVGPQSADTKGGPAIDLDGRCLRGGEAVPGLYACGNASGAISGDAYWSGGVPIASAMLTGYVAGRHAAALAPQSKM